MSKERNDNITYRTINIENGLYEKIAEIARVKYDTNLRRFLNMRIANIVQREALLDRMSPFLTTVLTQDKSIFIKDTKLDKVLEVLLNVDNEDKLSLYCKDCESDSCVHVAYSMASIDLGKLNP
jgi:hypothetical protein